MRAARVLDRLRLLVPPRVTAAVLRTWFNGWCTKHRFQGRGACIFGCSMGADKVDHYMRCTRLHGHGLARLRLPFSGTAEERGLCFFLFECIGQLTHGVPARRALLLTAAYKLHCRLRYRRGFANAEEQRRALDQAVKEAALGHAGAMRVPDGIWATLAV